jgi:hypothetical protein
LGPDARFIDSAEDGHGRSFFEATDQDLGLQKNALLGGALTGAALSLTEPNPRADRVISGAITGGAIATAAEFLRNLTS